MSELVLHKVGPGCTVQDMGRPGQLSVGLSRGGAADTMALIEAAALLDLKAPVAGIEMAGMGLDLSVTAPMRVALTGAVMQASLNGSPVGWNRSLSLAPGDQLRIGAVRSGLYGYVVPAGGVATPPVIGARATHLAAGLGQALAAGDHLPVGEDAAPGLPPMALRPEERFAGGEIRVMPGPQTGLFDAETQARFHATAFTRSQVGNRQGVRLDHEGAAFASDTKGIASDLIRPGDIQMTGDGTPYILLAECQTMGGYPRIGTVIPADLPRVAQAAPGQVLRPRGISVEEADVLWRSDVDLLRAARARVAPLRRDPHDIPDLLSYQLIGGVIRGDEDIA